MNRKISDRVKKTCLAMMSLILMLSLLPACMGEAAEDKGARTETISASFPYYSKVITWNYPYSDALFLQPSDVYSHPFAQLSMGVAYAAFRSEHKETQDEYLIDCMEKAGFGEIDTQTYREEPSAYSIAYGFAQKKIGDVTVIACAVCGGNYGKEWASNLTIGKGETAQGFAESAQKVEKALDKYLEEHPAEGGMKLWVTGHSRGAAVGNIIAADCTDSGKYKDVYAYLFATPRTTKDRRDYRNIFNIIGKDDPVPKIPLADWGYPICELAMWFFIPVIPMLNLIPMILVCIVLLSLAWTRYRRNKTPQTIRRFGVYAATIIVYAVLKGLFAGKITEVKGILIVVIYITFFVAALLLFHSEKTEGAQVAGKAVTEGT